MNRADVPSVHSLALVGVRNMRGYKARIGDERVCQVIQPMLMGHLEDFGPLDPDVRFVLDLRLVRRRNGSLEPANPIYGEVIIPDPESQRPVSHPAARRRGRPVELPRGRQAGRDPDSH